MATTSGDPTLSARIDHHLLAIDAEADFLPDLAQAWAQEPDHEQYVWSTEWWRLMRDLELLHREYHAGTMTAEQQQRFRALRQKLRVGLPLLQQMGLPLPPVTLAD